MLVYANAFTLNPPEGPIKVMQLISDWASKGKIDANLLLKGISRYEMSTDDEEKFISSRVTIDDQRNPVYPFFFCAQMKQRRYKEGGRSWISEIGLHQETERTPFLCTITINTVEISARVAAPVTPSRPKIVNLLLTQCNPVAFTPSLRVGTLTVANAPEFAGEIERLDRDYPLVVVSVDPDGEYGVEPDKLTSLLTGLAQVVVIPAGEDTRELERILTRRYIAFGGAINTIYPKRSDSPEEDCRNYLILGETIGGMIEAGRSVETEVLSIITHARNAPLSWRHISPEKVTRQILQRKLTNLSGNASASAELAEFLAACDETLKEKDNLQATLDAERSDFDSNFKAYEETIAKLNFDNATLQDLLNQAGRRSESPSHDHIRDIFNNLVTSLAKDKLTLVQILKAVSAFYDERVVILPSAFSSAEESDEIGFNKPRDALLALLHAAEGYWKALKGDGSVLEAEKMFGSGVSAQNETKDLTKSGEDRRTFLYKGKYETMLSHLRVPATGAAPGTAIRIHFKWFDKDKKLVIGWCGPHLAV